MRTFLPMLVGLSLASCEGPASIDFTLAFPSEESFLITTQVDVGVYEFEDELCERLLSGETAPSMASLTAAPCTVRDGATLDPLADGKYVFFAEGTSNNNDPHLMGCHAYDVSPTAALPINISLVATPEYVVPENLACTTIEQKCRNGVQCVPE